MLKQIDTTNIGQLTGAWITRLKRSGFGIKDSAEATPLVKDGIGNDDVFALNAETGEILWKRWSWIDEKMTTVCCGWDNRGLAMGESILFVGQLDANVVALDLKTVEKCGKRRSGAGTTAIASPVHRFITPALFIAASPTANSASAGDSPPLTPRPVRSCGLPIRRRNRRNWQRHLAGSRWCCGAHGASIWNTPALDPQFRLI